MLKFTEERKQKKYEKSNIVENRKIGIFRKFTAECDRSTGLMMKQAILSHTKYILKVIGSKHIKQ